MTAAAVEKPVTFSRGASNSSRTSQVTTTAQCRTLRATIGIRDGKTSLF